MQPTDDPASLAAARQELEAERDRRIQLKIDRGEAVRESRCIVTGIPDPNHVAGSGLLQKERDEQGREVYHDVDVIVTGVPRRGRDCPDLPLQVHTASKPDKEEPRRSEGTALRLPEGHPGRATLAPPEPEAEPSERRYICVPIEQPTENKPGGTIAEGYAPHT